MDASITDVFCASKTVLPDKSTTLYFSTVLLEAISAISFKVFVWFEPLFFEPPPPPPFNPCHVPP